MYKEKRNFARLALHAKANIHLGEELVEAEVENLSMKGVFVTSVRRMEIEDKVAAPGSPSPPTPTSSIPFSSRAATSGTSP